MGARRPLRILAVYAHVADTASEAAGTIAIQTDLGDTVTTVVCTDGERHHSALFLDANEAPGRPEGLPWLQGSIDQIRALKRREARRVGDILGVRDVRFLGWEDGHIDRFIFGHPCSVATGPDEILAIWYAGGATRTAIHSARLHIE